MPKSIYRKLTRRARALDSYSQLWLAPDHLLLVRSTRFREQYWRFALADIQAIVVTELAPRVPIQVVLAACAIAWSMIALAISGWFFRGFFLVSGGVWLLFVILDIARGPRCRCYLHTAVSRELLAPVNRTAIARRFLDQIQPAIEAVQGSIPPEQLPQMEERVSPPAPVDEPPAIAEKPGYLAEVVFGVFFANAAAILVGVFARRSQANNILISTLPGEMLLTVVALFRGSRDPRRYIYFLLGAALVGMGWDVVDFFRVFVRLFQAAVDAGAHGHPAPVGLLSDAVFPRAHAFLAAGWRIAAGSVGFALAYFERKRATRSPSLPIALAEPQ